MRVSDPSPSARALRTHQSRIFAAQEFSPPLLASAADGKQPKAGRARARHAGEAAAGKRAQRRQHFGDRPARSAIAGASRSFGCAARNCRSCSRLVSLAEQPRASSATAGCRRGRPSGKDRLGRQRDAGIDQHRRQRRQRERRGEHFADAAHQPRARIEADRHVGAGRAGRLVEARIVGRKTVRPRQQPQRRGRIGRAAAEPGRDRQASYRDGKRPSRYPECAPRARAPP